MSSDDINTGVLDDIIGQIRAADVWDTVGGY